MHEYVGLILQALAKATSALLLDAKINYEVFMGRIHESNSHTLINWPFRIYYFFRMVKKIMHALSPRAKIAVQIPSLKIR